MVIPSGTGGLEPEPIAAALDTLEPRVWAHLLRALRRVEVLPAPFAGLLGLPTSDLASGPHRNELSRLLGAEPMVRSALLADPALPAAAHRVLAQSTDRTAGNEGHVDSVEHHVDGGDIVGDDRAAARPRELRRELAEVRRQRDGAEARAGVAERRVEEVDAVRVQLESRVAELESAIALVGEEVTQAVARSERRSASRIEELERTLATERSTLDALRRASERDRVALEAARDEIEELRSRPTVGATTAKETSRPLELPAELGPDTTAAARWLLDGADVLLVDGYNVSLALHGSHPLSEQRRWLVDRLRPLVSRGRTAPVVVFDGDGEGRSLRDPSGVEIRFTASGTIADDEIVFAVAAMDGPVLVITDDAELQERVRAEGGNVLGTVHLLGAIEG